MLCVACGTGETSDYKVYNEHQLRKCSTCGFVFTSERNFSTTQYDKVYAGISSYTRKFDEAKQTHEGSKGLADLWWSKKKALKWLSRLHITSLLDLGSGPGTFLMVARHHLNCEVEGVEPAERAASVANQYGIATHCGSIEDFATNHSGGFDAITSFEVLEHVTDPFAFLRGARQVLKADGVLILSVPNLDDPYCLQQTIPTAMPPIHINFFTRRSVDVLLRRAGFKVSKFFTLPVPSSTVRNLYGAKGFLLRLPYLILARLFGRADGTTLLVLAKPAS